MTTSVKPLFLECDRIQVVTSWVGIAAYTMLVSWYARWIVTHIGGSGSLFYTLPPVVFLALFLADLVSGLVHWGTDTWFDEIVYTRIISIAREHHIHPHHIVGYGFRDYVAYSAWPTMVLLGPLGLVLTLLAPPSPVVFHVVVLLFIISACMFFGTYAHRLGHKRSPWRIVRLLQRCKFLIDTRYHGVHHRDNHDIRYCVINGWANYVCDAIGFWRGLERLIQWLTGAEPRKNDHEWFARFDPYSPRRGRFVIGPLQPAAGGTPARES